MVLGGASTAAAQTYATYPLEPAADTYVDSDMPTTPYGSATILSSERRNNRNERPAFRWDFSTIPAGTRLVSASLRLAVGDPQSATVGIHRPGVTWSEASTWNSTGGMSPVATPSATFAANTGYTFYTIPLTTLVGQWLSGAVSNTGIVLVPTTVQNTIMQLTSREYGVVEQRPLLTLTMLPPPALTPLRSSTVVSDPLQGAVTPKRIPGAVLTQNIVTENRSSGYPDANTVVLVEPVQANTSLYVGDLGAAGSGPVVFTQGAVSSGLSFAYAGLASTTDDVAFSNDLGVTFNYVPVPDAGGYDAAVTHVRIAPKGTFAGEAGLGYPSFTLGMRTRLR
jgi:hypothetical protein